MEKARHPRTIGSGVQPSLPGYSHYE